MEFWELSQTPKVSIFANSKGIHIWSIYVVVSLCLAIYVIPVSMNIIPTNYILNVMAQVKKINTATRKDELGL